MNPWFPVTIKGMRDGKPLPSYQAAVKITPGGVFMDENAVRLAQSEGEKAAQNAKDKDLYLAWGQKAENAWSDHILGSYCELAVAILLDGVWNVSHDKHWRKKPDVFPDIQVRGTHDTVHPGLSAHDTDPDWWRGVCGIWNAEQPQMVLIPGWRPMKDAKKDEYWQDRGKRSYYKFPIAELFPVYTLADTPLIRRMAISCYCCPDGISRGTADCMKCRPRRNRESK